MATPAIEAIYNKALRYIGDYGVTSGRTTEKQYVLCDLFYEDARDEILTRHLWNEATEYDIILQSTTAPIFGYDYKFQLPSDCLRVFSIGPSWKEFVVVGDYIYTNSPLTPPTWQSGEDYVAGQYVNYGSLTYSVDNTVSDSTTAPDSDATNFTSQGDEYKIINLTYIKQLTDPDEWSNTLLQAVVLNLATKLAAAMTNNYDIRSGIQRELEGLYLPLARSVDAQQGTPRKIFQSHWLRARGIYEE